MAESPSTVSPVVAIAAVSVIVFSAVGVGVMTGVIPSTFSKPSEQPVKPEAPQAAVAPAPAESPANAGAAGKPIHSATAEKPKHAAPAPKKHVEEPARVAVVEPEPAKTVAQVCSNCGSVISVDLVKHQGEGTGLGAVAGGVVGGVLGNQVGQGRGRTAATVVGAGAGAYAGHEIEKRVKSTQSYSVAVRMDDGTSQTFSYETEPAFKAGDKVKVVDGKLVAN